MPNLPPLAAIRAFEAAARHGSFTKAAAELGMTQAAVSYQVKLLEDRLGMPLFLRQARKVVLSETGRRLAPPVAEAFQRLEGAFASLRETSESVLTITAVHTFASNWLVPRLGAFQMAHPDIAVRLEVSTRTVDLHREDYDIGIRGGRGVWPGVVSHRLIPMQFTPLCSPDFLARHGPIEQPSDLMRVTRLDTHDAWWPIWFAAAGLPEPARPAIPNISLDVQAMLGSAAVSGQGVAILTPALFAPDIAAGRLVQLFGLVATDGTGYWLAYADERKKSKKIRAFRDWILKEVEAGNGPG
jgi:LysR family transcriptional regulator, glycine cleavage system transcriptional activator